MNDFTDSGKTNPTCRGVASGEAGSKPIPLPPKPNRLPVLMNHGGNGNNTSKESLPQPYIILIYAAKAFFEKKTQIWN